MKVGTISNGVWKVIPYPDVSYHSGDGGYEYTGYGYSVKKISKVLKEITLNSYLKNEVDYTEYRKEEIEGYGYIIIISEEDEDKINLPTKKYIPDNLSIEVP